MQLTLFENGLIPVYKTDTGEKVVGGRELHNGLKIGKDFTTWIKDKILKYGFVEGEDFSPISGKTSNGRPRTEYILKMDTAKELAMVENNEIGKQVRRYFIEVEKQVVKSQEPFQPPNAEKLLRAEAMLLNSKSRMASMYLKLSNVETLSKEYKNILVSKATEVLSGQELLPLPRSKEKKTYSATEIGEMFSISKSMVGRIANNNNLKTEEYGEFYKDKSPHSSKEVDSFKYFDSVIPRFEKILGKIKVVN